MERVFKRCQIRSLLLRQCLAEFLGVYVLIVSLFIYSFYNFTLLIHAVYFPVNRGHVPAQGFLVVFVD